VKERMTEYVHVYSEIEALRLSEQADTLERLLHHDTIYPPGAKVLEAGCGVGAQTIILAKNNPEAEITSFDISPESLGKARDNLRACLNIPLSSAGCFYTSQSSNHYMDHRSIYECLT
jgi:methylase of polypeptide subunit release factors